MEKSNLTLSVRNTTGSVINLALIGGAAAQSNVNHRTQYKYEITHEVYETDAVTIQARRVGEGAFREHTAILKANDVSGLVVALNSLGFGTWYVSQEEGKTFVNVFSDSYEFSELLITPLALTLTTTPTTYSGLEILATDRSMKAMVEWGDGTVESYPVEVDWRGDPTITLEHDYEVEYAGEIKVYFERSKVKELGLDWAGETSGISSLEEFINCTSLNVWSEQLTELPALPRNLYHLSMSNMPALALPTSFPLTLRELEWELNGRTVLPVINAPGLTYLNIFACTTLYSVPAGAIPDTVQEILASGIGMSDFANFHLPPALKILTINDIETTGTLSGLVLPEGFESLYCYSSNITTFGTAVIPSTLKELDVQSSWFASLPDLSHTALERLLAGQCASLTALPALPATLTYLALNNTGLTGVLPAIPDSVSTLSISNTTLTGMTNVPSVLETFYVSGTRMVALPDLSATRIKQLLVNSSTYLTTFPVLNPEYIEVINVSYTYIATVPNISHYTKLRELRLGGYHRLTTVGQLPDNLATLNIEASSVLASMANIPTGITYFRLYQVGIATLPSFAGCTQMQKFYLNTLANYTDFPVEQINFGSTLQDFWSDGTKLSVQEVSDLLIRLNGVLGKPPAGASKSIYVRQNPAATPNAAGLAAKASLVAKGWTVVSN